MNFWDNILRYPRFFFSSLLGLILVILTPIIKVLKEFRSNLLVIFVVLLSLTSVVWVLVRMVSLD